MFGFAIITKLMNELDNKGHEVMVNFDHKTKSCFGIFQMW